MLLPGAENSMITAEYPIMKGVYPGIRGKRITGNTASTENRSPTVRIELTIWMLVPMKSSKTTTGEIS